MSLTMYGTPTCVDCLRSKRFLESHNVAYDFINIASEPDAAAKVQDLNNGLRIVPTIVFDDGSILTEPSDAELAEKLGISL